MLACIYPVSDKPTIGDTMKIGNWYIDGDADTGTVYIGNDSLGVYGSLALAEDYGALEDDNDVAHKVPDRVIDKAIKMHEAVWGV